MGCPPSQPNRIHTITKDVNNPLYNCEEILLRQTFDVPPINGKMNNRPIVKPRTKMPPSLFGIDRGIA